ncbi:TPA: hypothetical protein ACH3X1_001481 [Trebouxia sp. C0004]
MPTYRIAAALQSKVVTALLLLLVFSSCTSAARDAYLFGDQIYEASRSLVATNVAPVTYSMSPTVPSGYGAYGMPGSGAAYGGMAMAPLPAPAPAPGPEPMPVDGVAELLMSAPGLPEPAI